MIVDNHKIMIVENTSSCIKKCTQFLEFDLNFRVVVSQGLIYKEEG